MATTPVNKKEEAKKYIALGRAFEVESEIVHRAGAMADTRFAQRVWERYREQPAKWLADSLLEEMQ